MVVGEGSLWFLSTSRPETKLVGDGREHRAVAEFDQLEGDETHVGAYVKLWKTSCAAADDLSSFLIAPFAASDMLDLAKHIVEQVRLVRARQVEGQLRNSPR